MGEVYRARDARLGRTVAIKVLPAHLSSDAELKQRLEREAKAISALQHANICTLYDIGTQGGTEFLVMEFLEGQTLAERLQKGPLPLDQVLKIGTEIAGALEKAHQQEIIHRDLKPANIMLTKGGAKLMDFGLAKPKLAIASQPAAPFTPSTPTMNLASLTSAASPLTQKGSIVGTFQYMAPEVLQGSEADVRSDLFSFGCVLYEMVTGRRAFEGKSQLSVLTAILEKEPEPIRMTQPLTPVLLDGTIRACLAKDPAERMQTAHDVAINLRCVIEAVPSDSKKSQRQVRKRWVAGVVALLVALLALAGFLGYRWALSSNLAASLHSEIPPPDKFLFDATGDAGGMPVLSPQGDKLAFVAHSTESKLLWVRSLSSDFAQPLEGTSGAAHPFWSPDGRYIGFFAGAKLMKVPADGGPIITLAAAPNPRGGAWGAEVIVFAADYTSGLMKVNAQGGTVEPATELDRTKHSTHRWPWFLPDGKHFLFLAANHTGGDPQQNGIYFASVDNKETRLIVATESSAQYASGYLLYRTGTGLVAQPFDPHSGTLSGAAIPVVNNLRDDVGVWRNIFSVSQNGLMTYETGSSSSVKSVMLWYDRAGQSSPTCDPEDRGIIDVRLSPNNKEVAYAGASAIWICDLQRNTKTRVTFDNQLLREPAWSPDGKMLMFAVPAAKGGGEVEIRSKPADGTGPEKTLLPQSGYHYAAWTPDGKYITYLWGEGQKQVSLWILPVGGDEKPKAVVQPPSAQSNLLHYRVSPDGRWVAYASDESGQDEIYLTTFPEGKGKWRISGNGGIMPAWSGNGREILYRNATDDFFACPIAVKGMDVEVGKPQQLFHASTPGIGVVFDVSLNGKHLLVNHADAEIQSPLHLVTNWLAELKK